MGRAAVHPSTGRGLRDSVLGEQEAGLGGDPSAGQNEAAVPLAPGIPWISAETSRNGASAVISFSQRSGWSHWG